MRLDGSVAISLSLRPEASLHGVGVTVVCPGPTETSLLDSAGPADLPIDSEPDIRGYLTGLAGPAQSVDRLAGKVVRSIEKNQAIVVPASRPRMLWRLVRWAPRLMDRLGAAQAGTNRHKYRFGDGTG